MKMLDVIAAVLLVVGGLNWSVLIIKPQRLCCASRMV